MAARYEAPKPPRFELEMVNGVEQIRIPAVRNWFVMLFLPVWLTAWAFGWVMAARQLLDQVDPFLIVWLTFWTVGGLYALAILLWQFIGAEIIRVSHGDLEISYRSPGFNKTWLYRGQEIDDLSPAGSPDFFHRYYGSLPHMTAKRWGAVKFTHGARTIHIAAGLDEAEGALIVEWLRKHLS